MLNEFRDSQLVEQFSLLSPGDKLAVTKLLDAREQYLLKELVRRHRQKEKTKPRSPLSSNGEVFTQCSNWLSRALFDLLDPAPTEIEHRGPTPAVRSLVKNIYMTVGADVQLTEQEGRNENKSERFVQKVLANWKKRVK